MAMRSCNRARSGIALSGGSEPVAGLATGPTRAVGRQSLRQIFRLAPSFFLEASLGGPFLLSSVNNLRCLRSLLEGAYTLITSGLHG
ncbi:hypothetical protein WJX84_002205 [Apatococcus fuscideae]|uniref:Uncharacterized protein n=1 Tax=Apatococcus fuscideae TaxID=2026836 RepID=A0AAW1T1E2_9CHLO